MRDSLYRMVTEGRAARIARSLFPNDYADGRDCKDEVGRKGLPCRVCAERNERWAARVTEVRKAVMEAFS